MRSTRRHRARLLGPSCALLVVALAVARCAPAEAAPPAVAASRDTGQRANITDHTWVDHDRQPIRRPPDWEPNYIGKLVRHGFIDPLTHIFDIPDKLLWVAGALGAHPEREAVNVNAFDEVPNSSWFTNRNHVRAVPVAKLRQGPDSIYLPPKPWTIKDAKRSGRTPGFRIKDAQGKNWLVKLDPLGHPQLSGGADMISRTLYHAAGYEVPHNQPIQFRRADLTIDPKLLSGAEGERFTESDLDAVLAHGAVFPDGSYSAFASLFISGHALGAPSMDRRRPGDSNDWYAHTNRRELRGLYVLCSWLNNWDTKDHQFLDMFVETRDSLGHVNHYILDAGSSFGAAAGGPKRLSWGYEHAVDFGWIARRFVTLGFVEEPWRRAHQETGIPSVGNYESAVYEPDDFKTLAPQPAFREMTDRDGYWGAKIVASFSDRQIAAAVEAAHYRDPRAYDYIVRNLIMRRDKIARHWFGRVAPLDFFHVEDGVLRFHDLAVELGLAGARAYDVEVETAAGDRKSEQHLHLRTPELPLGQLGSGGSHLWLEIAVAGDRAKPAYVELTRKDSRWIVTRVRHG